MTADPAFSRRSTVAPADRRRDASRRVSRFLRQFHRHLRDRRFWITQALVLGISGAHTTLEATRHLGMLPDLALLPVSTYFIPVVYAALTFGVEGAVPTALWSTLLTLPNLILWHGPAQRPGILLQLALLIMLAYVIARRVDSETDAKERAEAASAHLEEYVRLATDAQEEERKRLARELHDGTIQNLVVAKAELDALTTDVPLAASVGARLKKVETTLTQTIDDVRRFSRDLRPSLLDDLGLLHAIDWLVDDLRARTQINTDLRTSGDARRLKQNDELALFRIVQEALHNVERHAHANNLRVRIRFGQDVRATIVDDGNGFDTSAFLNGDNAASKLGLLGMQERAKLAGATLSIRSRPSSGTRVVVALRTAD